MTHVLKKSQEQRVHDVLEQASLGILRHSEWIKDGWVNKQYFVKVMGFTQAGRAIHNLEKQLQAETALIIEHSTFIDEFGFKSYRLSTNLSLF